MRVVNTFGLPQAVVEAATSYTPPEERREGADISVTELIGPPRIKQLNDIYHAEVVRDASELIWSLLGKRLHSIIERSAKTPAAERLFIQRTGLDKNWVISGEFDLWEDYTIWDFKEVKAASVRQSHEDWDWQLNIYRLMAEENGLKVVQLKNLMIIRDYSPVERYTNPEYPIAPAFVRDVRLYKRESVENFINYRLNQHELKMPMCEPSERWAKPQEFALYTPKSRDKAFRVRKTMKDIEFVAQTLIKNGTWAAKDLEIKMRPGEDLRCKYYCKVAEWCSHGQRIRGIETDIPD